MRENVIFKPIENPLIEKITEHHRQRLLQGIHELGIFLPEILIQKILQFLQLLQQWNQTYSLTAIDQIEEMINRHLLDSLSITPFIRGKNILDVGSGAGFPGIPLSFCFPQREFTLLDSNGKKIRFLNQARLQCSLTNIMPIHSRLENFHPQQGFDTIVFRAVGAIYPLFQQAKSLLKSLGICIFMKGTIPQKELKAMESEIVEIIPLQVPFISAERHLVIVSIRS